jgi:hypothetical protein
MSVGANESKQLVADTVNTAGRLRGRHYASLDIEHHIFDDETHLPVIPAAISRGLVFLFGNR